MSRPALHDLESLRAWVRTQGAAFVDAPEEVRSTGLPALDALLPGGGFPLGGVSVISGAPGSGRMTIAASVLAQETAEGRPVAWIDGRGTLYPPALAAQGVRLERLLIVRPGRGRAKEAAHAAEQVVSAGVFRAVVVTGVEPALDSARAKRLSTAAEETKACALLIADPGTQGGGQGRAELAKLVLVLERRDGSIVAELEKSRRGNTGRRAVV